MSGSMQPYDPVDPGDPTQPPSITPGAAPGATPVGSSPQDPAAPSRPRLDAGRYWRGVAVTALVSALLGFAAAVILGEVFDLDIGADSAPVTWTLTAGFFALLAGVVLYLLVLGAPRPRMFFGWLVTIATLILAVLPFTASEITVESVLTALAWVVLGIAVYSMTAGVLSRTLVPGRRL
ncbi:hypothetical protein ACNHYB_00095 [Isoptericola jiangsuensis]|uniref:hypothetical protein n=1 Tax=Isoptericola jiangsuensis TaxID=548579 RepID=UPI003AACE4D4